MNTKVPNGRKGRYLLWGLLAVYLFLLVWIILFKLQTDFSVFSGTRSLNLVPYGASAVVNGSTDLSEIFNNILVFVPFGLYLSLLFPGWSWGRKVLLMAAVSLLLEICQYVLAVGSSDLTDLINNTLGGLAGIGLYQLLAKLLGRRTTTVLTGIACFCTAALVGLLALLLMYN